uniref:Uncharacterized protein n=1 Tax=Anguilla anguilla TaxID=7936 RepID=A0A0E9UYN1_ANGAN
MSCNISVYSSSRGTEKCICAAIPSESVNP